MTRRPGQDLPPAPGEPIGARAAALMRAVERFDRLRRLHLRMATEDQDDVLADPEFAAWARAYGQRPGSVAEHFAAAEAYGRLVTELRAEMRALAEVPPA